MASRDAKASERSVLEGSTMSARGGATAWIWAGFATAVLAGMALTQADDLQSATERLAAIDLGVWLDWSELRVASIRWKFAVTPFAAWWMMAVGGLWSWIGWRSRHIDVKLPFGISGCAIWLATWGVLSAATLPVVWLFVSIQSWIALYWLMKQKDFSANEGDLRPFLASQLTADVCTLAGVLLAGIAWGTFDIAGLRDPQFVYSGWRQNPAACSAAGAWLFLGFACRCAWFPWLPATRIVLTASPLPAAMFFAGVILPATAWWWIVILPLLGIAPEVVAIVQGAALAAALIAAFIATAQTDHRRIILLMVSMQFGLIASATVLPGILSPLQIAIVMAAACLLMATLLTSPNGWQGQWAWWLLVGGCLSPLFWTVTVSVEQFDEWKPLEPAAVNITEDEVSREVTFRVKPLPMVSWVAAWCLISFCAAFAARRAAATNFGSGQASDRDWLGLGVATGLAVLSAWLAKDEIAAGELWPAALATITSLLGWSLASSFCRNIREVEFRFRERGLWEKFSQRDSVLDEGVFVLIGRTVSRWSQSVRNAEEISLPRLFTGGIDEIATRLKAAVEELRNEPAGVYPVAFATLVGSMVATWMWLMQSP